MRPRDDEDTWLGRAATVISWIVLILLGVFLTLILFRIEHPVP